MPRQDVDNSFDGLDADQDDGGELACFPQARAGGVSGTVLEVVVGDDGQGGGRGGADDDQNGGLLAAREWSAQVVWTGHSPTGGGGSDVGALGPGLVLLLGASGGPVRDLTDVTGQHRGPLRGLLGRLRLHR